MSATQAHAKWRLLFTGTDPQSTAGGIGTVAGGYLLAAKHVGLKPESVPTYAPTPLGKTLLWLLSLPGLLCRIAAAHVQGVCPVVYSHTGGGVSFLREACVLACCRLVGARTIMHIHAPQVDSYLRNPFGRALLKLSFLPAHRLVALTPWWKRRLEQAGVRKPIHVISNPLPNDLQQIAQKERIRATDGDGGMRVLTMCRLVPGKGVDVALRAVAALPGQGVRIDIAGDGSEAPALLRLAAELGLGERVSFLGWVMGKQKQELLEQADVFCLPSTNDVYPMSMVEAMCHGVPVVGVAYAGIPDMVASGRVGLLVESQDPGLVADALSTLLAPAKREEMGREGKKWVQDISSPRKVGEALKALLETL